MLFPLTCILFGGVCFERVIYVYCFDVLIVTL